MISPVTPAIFLKISTWFSAFCPVVASSVSKTVCGAAGVELPDHPDDLFQLRHQIRLVLQASGGVDDQNVAIIAPLPCVKASCTKPGRIGAGFTGDDRRAWSAHPRS